MRKRVPQQSAFVLDYVLDEQPINRQWINGKPIYRQVLQLVGGNGSSTLATNLNNVVEIFVSGVWTGITATGWFINAGTTSNGITLDAATGLLTVRHTGENLTGDIVGVILEYTKQ